MASRLLVVQDEPATGTALQGALSLEGFDVVLAEDHDEALDVVASEVPDAVIVEVAAPTAERAAFCRRLREARPRLPVLMLGSRDGAVERSGGLVAGADDYIEKPFVLIELVTRLRALLRRAGRGGADVLRFADLVLDPATREVVRADRPVELTLTEFSLLELFLTHPREVLPRSLIFTRVWGFDFAGTSNSLNVYIGHLRRKIEAAGEVRLNPSLANEFAVVGYRAHGMVHGEFEPTCLRERSPPISSPASSPPRGSPWSGTQTAPSRW
jgi:two-component system response regulator MprA